MVWALGSEEAAECKSATDLELVDVLGLDTAGRESRLV